MVTIREISEYTGLSPSTVSIVLNGKAKDRNISEKTAKKVMDAAKELGYSPNISARRLRKNNTKKYVAVFWANDFRAPLLFEFIHGMQKRIEDTNMKIEIVLRLFTPDHLYKSAQPDQLAMYSATIVCTASKKDLEYLENNEFSTPVVLYNRFSEKYSHIYVDNEAIGAKAAEIFASHGKNKAVVFTSYSNHYKYSEKRISGFINTFSNTGGSTTVINSPSTNYKTSIETISEMESVFKKADCVFFLHDKLAISYINYIAKNKIVDIPSSQELISIGYHDNDVYDYMYIPLSIIEVPIEAMGYECMRMIIEKLEGNFNSYESKMIDFIYTPRLSCM